MAFVYKVNVLDALKSAGYSSTRIRREHLLGESYMTQLRRGQMISWAALDTVCGILNYQLSDIIQHIKDECDTPPTDNQK